MKNIKRVAAFRSEDGVLHDNELDALNHQMKADLTKSLKAMLPVSMQAAPPEIFANGMIKQSNYIKKLLQAYTIKIGRARRKMLTAPAAVA